MTAVASAASSAVDVLSVTSTQVQARVEVPVTDPVFAGHYPGFPVLPGVYLIEFADRVAQIWLSDGNGRSARLAAIDSCRFRGPVYPGERLELRLSGVEGELNCTVTLSTASGPAADLKLRYQEESA
jgi:3-hydroxyacyl-[acyl-carrier-protein] dehydratase